MFIEHCPICSQSLSYFEMNTLSCRQKDHEFDFNYGSVWQLRICFIDLEKWMESFFDVYNKTFDFDFYYNNNGIRETLVSKTISFSSLEEMLQETLTIKANLLFL